MDKRIFDEGQREAICTKDGAYLCIAGPGAGKTTVLTYRVLNLIDSGVNPFNILVITFTKKAAVSMERRFKKLIGEDSDMPVTFGTFHSIFYRLIRHFGMVKSGSLVDDSERLEIMYQVLKELGFLMKYDRESVNDALNLVGSMKNRLDNNKTFAMNNGSNEKGENVISGNMNNTGMLGIIDSEYAREILKRYNEILKQMNKIDYEDIMILMRELCIDHPEMLSEIRKRYSYIMIDEFQDINDLQMDIVRRITGNEGNIFGVGDEDQAIYGFRGANSGIMLTFNNYFKDARIIKLENNYRSDKSIVDVSSFLINNNINRYKKEIRSVSNHSGNLDISIFTNANEELENIKKIIENKRKGETLAILIRKNVDGVIISNYLDRNGIKHSFEMQGSSLYKMGISFRIIKDIKMALKSDYRYCIDARIIRKLKPERVLEYILNAKGYYLLAKSNVSYSGEIDILKEDVKRFETTKQWLDYVDGGQDYGVGENSFAVRKGKGDNEYAEILTMHGAKGLEFDTVIIPLLNEGIIPDGRVLTANDIEEERRLLYVAMTRAKHKLYISARKSADGKNFEVSRFYNEIVRCR